MSTHLGLNCLFHLVPNLYIRPLVKLALRLTILNLDLSVV